MALQQNHSSGVFPAGQAVVCGAGQVQPAWPGACSTMVR